MGSGGTAGTDGVNGTGGRTVPGSGGAGTGGRLGSGGAGVGGASTGTGGTVPTASGGSGALGGASSSGSGGSSGSPGADAGGGVGGSGGRLDAGGTDSGGQTSTGGMGGNGAGGAGSGGRSGPSGSGGQATTLQCRDGSGQLVPEMKDCASDDDCQAVPTYNCCGPGQIVGLAKNAQAYLACFQTTPPTGCVPGYCASYPSTEDNQTFLSNSDSVIARCFEVAAGRKACMTTVKGSCIDNATRCSTGETCKDECDQPCTCQQGHIMACARPTNGSACSMAPRSCIYSYQSVSSLCQCTVAAPVWSCSS